MTAPEITVVVPAYNRPDALARLLAALAGQVGVAMEVVVVDDGSPAPLAPLADAAPAGLSLRILRQDNAGPATARNTGAAAANAPLLAFTDDDCAPRPGWAAALRDAVAGPRPTIDTGPGTTTGPVLAAGATRNAVTGNAYAETSQAIADYIATRATDDGVIAPSNNVALPREAFLSLGGFDTRYPLAAGEDRAFCRTWQRQGWPIRPAPLARLDHHHDLDLRRFWRQHANYGRGAALFHTSDRAAPFAPLGRLGFYGGLLAAPWRHGLGVRGTALAMLSQLAVAGGMIAETRARSAPRS